MPKEKQSILQLLKIDRSEDWLNNNTVSSQKLSIKIKQDLEVILEAYIRIAGKKLSKQVPVICIPMEIINLFFTLGMIKGIQIGEDRKEIEIKFSKIVGEDKGV
jgi:hypothetical protein